MSAAEVPGKPARTARKAANSIVVSSETRKTATLATQKIGHGDACASPLGSAAALLGVALVVAAAVIGRALAGFLAASAADRLQVDRRLSRQALVHLARDVVGEHFARA